MSNAEPHLFKAQGFLKRTYLDTKGAKQVTLEFSASEALEIAKLELMGRDLTSHLPILLEVVITQVDSDDSEFDKINI